MEIYLGAVSISLSVYLHDDCKNLKRVIDLLQFITCTNRSCWPFCIHHKETYFLLDQQCRYTECPCVLHTWGSRALEKHSFQLNWSSRSELKSGDPNILHQAIDNRQNITFPPLHAKLGLLKQFLKILSVQGVCFKHFISKFQNPWIWKDKSVDGCIWWFVDTVAHLRCTFHRNNFRSLKRCLVGIQKPFQRHSRKYNRNLHRNCPVTFREFRISILITFLKILVQSLMSTVIVFSYIWNLWKKVIKVNGIHIWCLIIVVTSSEIAQNWTLQKKLQAKKFTL